MALTALQVMQDAPVIPVIVVNDVLEAVCVAQALVQGGVRMLEITLRTPQALACMEAIAHQVPGAIVGAGTMRKVDDVARVLAAGAQFAVSPGYTRALGQACRDACLPLLPGVATSSEIMQAQDDGFSQLKFFPAMQAGGIAMLKAWSGPFADVQFCPTGGVSASNAAEFLALPNVVCVGGSWLVPATAVVEKDWKHITQLARASGQLRVQS